MFHPSSHWLITVNSKPPDTQSSHYKMSQINCKWLSSSSFQRELSWVSLRLPFWDPRNGRWISTMSIFKVGLGVWWVGIFVSLSWNWLISLRFCRFGSTDIDLIINGLKHEIRWDSLPFDSNLIFSYWIRSWRFQNV